MSPSLEPSDYDTSKTVSAGRSDCCITVGFDQQQTHIPRFLVQLHYINRPDTRQWTVIARFDHNETSAQGHDIYQEGLHIDVRRPNGSMTKVRPRHGGLNHNRGAVIRACVEYLADEAQYFIDVYNGDISPGAPRRWPDGGSNPARNVISLEPRRSSRANMATDSEASGPDEPLSHDELSEVLAEATGTTPEEIEREAEAIEIEPPEDAEVVTE